jgi:hypothetical protein
VILGLAVLAAGGVARADDTDQSMSPSLNASTTDWHQNDWLKPAEDKKREDATGATFQVTAAQDIRDPFAILGGGSLWHQRYGVGYTRLLTDTLTLKYETTAVILGDGSSQAQLQSGDNLSQNQKVGLQFKPVDQLTLQGDVHNRADNTALTPSSSYTNGTAITADGRLPWDTGLSLGFKSDNTGVDNGSLPSPSTLDNTYEAQISKRLGKMPVTAVLKGRYEETSSDDLLLSRRPSLEQSLSWSPLQNTTLRMGLRQQHYETFPGLTNDYNQAVFADVSQKILPDILPDVTWHSYAEMLDAHSNPDIAPGVSIFSGANGTPQSSTPGSPGMGSAVPLLAEDKTLTFTTGPSFRLEKDISASIEYSNRWDQNPTPGSVGQEERVSVSVKGKF